MAERNVSKTPRRRASLPSGKVLNRGLQSQVPAVRAAADAAGALPVDDLIDSLPVDDPLRTSQLPVVADGSSRLTAPEATYAAASLDGGARLSPDGTRIEQILTLLKRHFDTAVDGDEHNTREALIDDEFRALNQWDPGALEDRKARGELALVVDQLSTPINQIVNAHRASLPAIKVSARGGNATKRTAEVAQNLIRRIEYDSMAPAVYAHAVDQAATNGRGHWKITVEYTDDQSMDQEIRIRKIANRYSIYRDPRSVEPDRSDARFWIETEDLDVDDFRAIYGNAAMASAVQFSSLGDPEWSDWVNETTIRVVTFWFQVPIRRRLLELRLPNGQTRTVQAELPNEDDYAEGGPLAGQPLPVPYETGDVYPAEGYEEPIPIVDHRDLDSNQWFVCTCNAAQILQGNTDKTDAALWPFKYCPIIETVGEEFMHQGRVVQRGIIRRGRDAQRLLNANVTDMHVAQTKTPKHQWSGFVGQFGEGPEDPIWQQYMRAASGRLPFVQAKVVLNPVTKEPLPAPVLNQYEPPIQNLAMGINMAMQFIRDTTGFHAAALGDINPEQRSGKLVENLQRASEQGTSHIHANFEVALCHSGRVIADMLDRIYNNRPGRLVYLMDLDGDETAVLMRQPFAPGKDGPVPLGPGEPFVMGRHEYIDLRGCLHQIAVRPGRSNLTVKDEMRRALEAIASSAPPLVPIIAPAWVRSIDAPGMDALADMLELGLPPQFRSKKDPTDLPPEAKAMLEQMGQVIEQLTQELQRAQMELEADAVGAASRERIAAMNNKAKLLQSLVSGAQQSVVAGRQDAMAMAQQFLQQMNQAGQQAHERVMTSIQAAQQKLQASASGGTVAQ